MDVNFHLTHSAHNATAQAGDMLTRSIHIAFLSASLFTSVKEALIEIGCVVTSLVVTRVHCGNSGLC